MDIKNTPLVFTWLLFTILCQSCGFSDVTVVENSFSGPSVGLENDLQTPIKALSEDLNSVDFDLLTEPGEAESSSSQERDILRTSPILPLNLGTEAGVRLVFAKPVRKTANPGFVQIRDPSRNWSAHIGKGGQMYSLRVAGSPDLIPKQPADAKWVDRVFQTVATDSSYTRRNPLNRRWFMHQAGTYQRGPLARRVSGYYSPLLWQRRLPRQGIFETLHLPQMAHVNHPDFRPERILLFQRIKNLGTGVLEITYFWMNHSYNNRVLDRFNFPWTSFKQSAVDFARSGRSSGAGSRALVKGPWTSRTYSGNSLNGWIGMFSRPNARAFGLSVISGRHNQFRFGDAVPSTQHDDDYQILSAVPAREKIRAGEAVKARIYLAIGANRNQVLNFSNAYSSKTEITFYKRNQALSFEPSFTGVCLTKPLFRCGGSDTPNLYLLRNWIPGSTPVFALTVNRNEVISIDPYWANNGPGYLTKTPSQFQVKRILGWALESGFHRQLIDSKILNQGCAGSRALRQIQRIKLRNDDSADLVGFSGCR